MLWDRLLCVAKRVGVKMGFGRDRIYELKNEVCGRGPGIFYEILSW